MKEIQKQLEEAEIRLDNKEKSIKGLINTNIEYREEIKALEKIIASLRNPKKLLKNSRIVSLLDSYHFEREKDNMFQYNNEHNGLTITLIPFVFSLDDNDNDDVFFTFTIIDGESLPICNELILHTVQDLHSIMRFLNVPKYKKQAKKQIP